MTNELILKKAIEKAVGNGYREGREWLDLMNDGLTNYMAVIFSHDFAKAFWGEKMTEMDRFHIYWTFDKFAEERYLKRWQWHLLKMVLEKEPLKYLEKFL